MIAKKTALALSLALTLVACGGDAAKKPVSAEAKAAADLIFNTVCFTCHGLDGKGDGVAASAFPVKPRNYTDKAWQKTVTDERLKKVIMLGGPAFGLHLLMTPQAMHFEGKPEGTLQAIVDKIRAFAK